MATRASSYILAEQGNRRFLLSKTSAAILRALARGSEFSYDELHARVDCERDSLYVFCQRLEKAKLLKRTKRLTLSKNGNLRICTTIVRVGVSLKFPKLMVIR